MRKYIVAIYSSFALCVSLYGLESPSYHLQQLIDTSMLYLSARVILAFAIAVYFFLPKSRNYIVRSLIQVIGASALAFAAITFISPTFFGFFSYYVPLGDVFLALEGGILALLLSAELPAHTSQLVAKGIQRLETLQPAQPQKLLPATSASAKGVPA